MKENKIAVLMDKINRKLI